MVSFDFFFFFSGRRIGRVQKRIYCSCYFYCYTRCRKACEGVSQKKETYIDKVNANDFQSLLGKKEGKTKLRTRG